MALFRRLFYRKPPDGLLEISERVYVFNCCFTTDAWEEENYKEYIGGIVGQLREDFADTQLLVFNFREENTKSLMADVLSEYDITIMDYPRYYEGCPLLTMEVIHHFLRSTESWLSLGQHNVLIMHCERGGWPVLAFMLAALLIYRKQYSGEQKTLDMIYRQAPRELLQFLSPLNPVPSQLRYLQYVSRRNVVSEWPPLDRALTLDCVILRFIPNFDGEGGCRPIFRIYGQDPFLINDRSTKVLYSTTKRSKAVRFYKQAECELVKIDINCHIQGDVVLECISLNVDMEGEEMMFRVVFNTAFIRSNILMLNRDEVDILWDAKDLFPKEFRAEILFSEMDAAASVVVADVSCFEEREGLPVEAFAKVHEIFSHVDWLDQRADFAFNVLQHISSSNIIQEKSDTDSPPRVGINSLLQETSPKDRQDKKHFEGEDKTKSSLSLAIKTNLVPSTNMSPNSAQSNEKEKPRLSWNTIRLPSQPCVMSQKTPEASQTTAPSCNSTQNSSLLVSGHHDASPAFGVKPLLRDHASSVSPKVTHQIATFSTVSDPTSAAVSCRPEYVEVKSDSISPSTPTPPSPPCPSLTSTAWKVTPTPRPRPQLPSHHLSSSKPTHFPFTKESESYLQVGSKSSLVSPSALETSSSSTISSTLVSTSPSFPALASPPTPPPKTHVSSIIDVSCSSLYPSSSTIASSITSSPPTLPPPLMPNPSLLPLLKENSAGPPTPPPPPPCSRHTIRSNTSSHTPPPPPPPPPPPYSTSKPPFPSLPTTSSPPPLPPPTTPTPAPPPLPPLKEKSAIKAGLPPLPTLPFCSRPFASSTTLSPASPPASPPSTLSSNSSLPPPPTPPSPPLSSNSSSAPPPAPPSPTLSSNSTSVPALAPPPPFLSSNSSSVPPPAPPPPPLSSNSSPGPPPAPPPPPLSSNSSSGPPPAPPPPTLSSNSSSVPSAPPPPTLSSNSSSVPSAPPPPIPFGKGVSVNGIASSVSNGGSPVPAPPPSSGKGRLSRTITSKGQQTKKLKPLHWLKLTRAVQGSLWAEAQKTGEASKAPEIDMKELENLFSAAVPNSDRGGKSSQRGPRGPKVDKVQLIEHRRAYNCEIMLSKVKVPLPDLMDSVLDLEESALDADQVENLIKFCPTKEEMEQLKGHTGDKEKLGKCEQFFMELMKVPRVESKLRVFSFKMQFRSQVSDLRNSLNVVNSAAEQVRNSAKLRRIMQTILSLGNALNQGTARGSAIGFRLDSLLKLTDTRARNNKMTLMHYLCKVLADKLPELLDFSQDLASLEPASKIQLKFLAEEMQALSKGLEKIVQELSMAENDGPISENFRKTLKEFLRFAEGEVRTLASLYSAVGRNVDALILYFGEDPSRCPFEQVISTLLNFVRMFNKAHNENSKQLELEKKKMAQSEKSMMNASHKESERLLHTPIQSGNVN
ncbi:Formin-like protein [Melia azedarach]|uniref:Formin-like protein n=1 Tax=Melia azedarach TaxID=155640 RepID=A0ACC1XGW2_MELAZ|nr:Formin-like protein [Melia azedarach]